MYTISVLRKKSCAKQHQNNVFGLHGSPLRVQTQYISKWPSLITHKMRFMQGTNSFRHDWTSLQIIQIGVYGP